MARRTTAMRPALALAALLLASGCGMYGDLYLEEPAPAAPPEAEELAPTVEDGEAGGSEAAPTAEEDKPKPQQPPPDGAATGNP